MPGLRCSLSLSLILTNISLLVAYIHTGTASLLSMDTGDSKVFQLV